MRRLVVVGLLLIALAAGVSLWLHEQRAKEDEAEQAESTYIPKTAEITPEIERLQRYVRIDTSNPPGQELAGANYLAGLIRGAGVNAEIIESAPGRASVYARIKGKRPNEGLLLVNHIDVVPADAKGWSRPPFAASIALNMMYGRGTLDMKGIGMCELEAFLDVARSGKVPERDIVFLAEADEEQGGTYGMQWLLAHRPDVVAGVKFALNEGGITETQREQITYFGIEVGTKMTTHVRVRAATKERLQEVRIALEPYMTPRDPVRVLPEVREFLHALAPQRVEQGQYLRDIDWTIRSGKFWLLQRPYKELMQNNVWARGIVEANGTPMLDVLLFNLPDEDPDKRLGWLEDLIRPFQGEIAEIVGKSGPAPLSSSHTSMFALLEREVHKQYGSVPVGTEVLAAFSNDSKFLRPRGIECYGFWPFPVDYFQSLGVHGVDERVRLDWYMDGIRLMRSVVQAYTEQPLP